MVWEQPDNYLYVYSSGTDERVKVFEKLGITARERWYMLILKAKFAGSFSLYILCMCA